MVQDMWSVKQYERFKAERTRPFRDLLSRIPERPIALAADLGCGTGEPTALLVERWPTVKIIGVDSSEAMLESARQRANPGHLEFVLADLATWQAPAPLDLIVSSAALHWLSGHAVLLTRLVSWLAPGGLLAVTMPGNFASPSHLAIAELAADPRWAASLAGAVQRVCVEDPSWYADHLLSLGCSVDAWETTYVQVLSGDDPVLEWVKGTALRPILQRLGASSAPFVAALRARLAAAYPSHRGVTLFPFRRIFFIATRE
jgi:trans-aconitate 2-methyltransferase